MRHIGRANESVNMYNKGRPKAIKVLLESQVQAQDRVAHKMPESASALWRMVSLTAAKTRRMFDVSVACVRLKNTDEPAATSYLVDRDNSLWV